MQTNNKKEIVKYFLEQNILISHDLLERLDEQMFAVIKERLGKLKGERLFLAKGELDALLSKDKEEPWRKDIFEGKNPPHITAAQKKTNEKDAFEHKHTEPAYFEDIDQKNSDSIDRCNRVSIIASYNEPPKKQDIQNFIKHYNSRFKALESMLRNRPELQNLNSIGRVLQKKERETTSIIGIVKEKIVSGGKIKIVFEDLSGEIPVIVDKSKSELFSQAQNITEDEVLGVLGISSGRVLYANSFYWPDVPLNKEIRKSPDKAYAMFLSDLHIGSKKFLRPEFEKFLRWLNNPGDNERHRDIVENLKYLFIIGDLVDGVGIYPGQEAELELTDIYKQYDECARLLRQIPEYVSIIICPGNHDALRLSEPQPPIYKEFAPGIYNLKNVTIVSNPALVNIHASKIFSGFDVLMYHGYSFDYFLQNIEHIRANGGYDRADLVMKFLLQRRHLSPTHTATLYVPDPLRDPLIINKVPDFFVTGHIHKTAVSNYRNVSLICGSCWQAKTAFQERVGHHPEPARVPVVNLQTRETRILRF
ncbi:MAG: DNA-directed DNA polymerase II small subunit [Candidatus Woesearchaeota archaeon]